MRGKDPRQMSDKKGKNRKIGVLGRKREDLRIRSEKEERKKRNRFEKQIRETN